MSERPKFLQPKNIGLVVFVAGIYFLAAKVGLSLAFVNASVSPVWPPTGVAIGLCLWFGYRAAPGVFLGALLANYLLTDVSFLTASGIAIGNGLEAISAVYLLRRFVRSRNPFNRAFDVLKFVVFASILSTTVSATIGNLTLCLSGAESWPSFGGLWLTWWLGDGVGAVVVTPLILSWIDKPGEFWRGWRLAEAGLLLVLLAVLSTTIYSNLWFQLGSNRPLSHVAIPVLLWAAFRFGPRGVSLALTVLSVIAIWGTTGGYGPFAIFSTNESLLYLQAYIANLAITTFALAAIVTERKHGERRLSGTLSVTRILAESPALDDALPRIMQRICDTFGWEIGGMWTLDSHANALRCLKIWPPRGRSASKFEAASYEIAFPMGKGLPGRVWKSLKPAWIPDVTADDNFPRAQSAAGEGLHAAFAFPILSGEKFLGVMEFFSQEIREPDRGLLATFTGIGSQIGQFMERKQAEEAVEFASLLPKENPSPVIRLTGGTILTYANPSAERVLAHWKVNLGEEAPYEISQIARSALSLGSKRNLEISVGEQTYLVDFAPVPQAHYVNLYFNDITDRKRTEEALLQNQAWLHLTMEGGRMGTWTRELDETNRVVWSPELEQIFGLQPGEFPQAEEAFFDFVHPEDREPLRQAVAAAIENHTDYDIEFRYTRKDGVEGWMLGRGRAFYDETGKPYGLAGLGWDITERKKAETESRQLAAIVQTSDDAIIGKDLDGIVTSWNAAAQRLYGYSAEEMIGKPVAILIPPERPDEEPEILAKLRRGESIDHYETVRMDKYGKRIDVSLTVSPITNANGKVIGASKIARDITQRKRAEQEREQLLAREQAARTEAEIANRIKDEFLATLSHELRTPLTAILGWLSMLRAQRLDQKTAEHALETIERNAKIQAQLIEDLVDVSRIVGGKLNLEVQPVDLLSVVEAAVEVVRPAAEARGVEIEVAQKSFVGPVPGDPARLQQVIWNLLSNAVKFTSRGGRVEAILQRSGSYAEVVIRDTGIGIGADFLPHVFERFRQAESSLTRSHRGLGLGLAIVRHLVELHGGTVRAESPGEGQGSTFTISLPLAETAKVKEPLLVADRFAASQARENDAVLKGLRVLVVEDEHDARELLSLILERSGATVEAVESAGEALRRVPRFKPNVLLSDIGLPAESGYDLIRKIRSLPPDAGLLPAVALTAFASDRDRELALSAGYQMHLAKPVDPNRVIDAVARLAGRDQ